MILKEIDKKDNLNKFQQYGYQAEKQMAFYLKMAFQDNNDIHVINDLRLEMNDDVAQIDHLIIHKFGFIIIESKSVTSKISINEHGEWIRQYPKYNKGMPSPVNQAIRQADFLKSFLMARSEQLLKKTLILKVSISIFKFDVLVAISDSGIINRAKNFEINEVHKADQITENAIKLISRYARTNKNILTLKANYYFANSTMDKILNYLINSHKPKVIRCDDKSINAEKNIKEVNNNEQPTAKELIDVSNKSENDKLCGKCGSKNIEITYGKYGYYFKCLECKGNTSIKLKCKHQSCKLRIRKDKLKFYKECSSCKTSELYFENKRS